MRIAWRSPCEEGGVAGETLASAYVVAREGRFSLREAVAVDSSSIRPASSVGRDTGAVLGVRRSGGAEDDGEDSDGGGQGPGLTTPFAGLGPGTGGPWFLALLAIMLAGATWIIRAFVRALR